MSFTCDMIATITGYFVIMFLFLWVLFDIIYALAVSISLNYCIIKANRINDIPVPWHRVPISVMRSWMRYIFCEVPNRIFNNRFEWRGIFNYENKRSSR